MSARLLLADDEPLLRDHLADSLLQLWPQAEIVAEVGDGIAALQAAQQLMPDVAFLDIRMPGLSGLELARALSPRLHVVLVTAYDEHAIAAFEEGAVDYLLKPLEPARLLKTISRLQARLAGPPRDIGDVIDRCLAATGPRYLAWVQASIGSTIHFLTIDEVWMFQSDAKYTRVVSAGLETFIRKPIKELREQLDPARFWQISRGVLVAVERIERIVRDDDGAMRLKLRGHDALLPVSQSCQHRFRQM